ncbi:hypothetical protein VUR80DRAFT_739 [Thermomyces stellatus]
MYLARIPKLYSGVPLFPEGLLRRKDNNLDTGDSTIVDVSGHSGASILVISLLVIACLTILLLTGYCVLSRQYDARAAAASRPWPRPRRIPAAEGGTSDSKIGEYTKDWEGRKERRKTEQSLTMIFRQHEPQAHGYFAPLYLEGPESARGPPLGDVKNEVSRVYEPEMLERAATRGEG